MNGYYELLYSKVPCPDFGNFGYTTNEGLFAFLKTFDNLDVYIQENIVDVMNNIIINQTPPAIDGGTF